MQIGIGIAPGFVPGKGWKGGGTAFDPNAQAQIDRIEAAGGVIESPELLDADVKFIKSLGLYNNWKYAIDPMCGINERVDGADTFVPKIFDYSSAKPGGIYADTGNGNAIEQPLKRTLNSQTALDFDGIDDRLVNISDISFPAGAEHFSVAVYAQQIAGKTDNFGFIIDKYSPDIGGKSYGVSSNNTDLVVYANQAFNASQYDNVQILASGNATTSDVLTGFINGVQVSQINTSANAVGKSLGSIRNRVGILFGKGRIQKNWDFNIIPTQSKIDAIYAYLNNQKI